MKYFKRIIPIIIVFILFVFIYVYIASNEFSISFWIKPSNVSYNTEILNIFSGEKRISVVENKQDSEFYDQGLTLVYNDGALYKDGSTILEINNYSQVVITYKNGFTKIYVDGECIAGENIGRSFTSRNIEYSFNEEIGTYEDITYYGKCLEEEEVALDYRKGNIRKLSNINFSEEIINDAKGKIALPLTRQKVDYKLNNHYAHIENDKYIVFEDNKTNEDHLVTLTASCYDSEKNIIFCIKGNSINNRLEEAKQKLLTMFNDCLSENTILPTNVDGFEVFYKVVNGNAFFDGQRLIKTEKALDKERIDIQISIEDYVFEKNILLLNEYYGYLLVSFDGVDGWPHHEYGSEKLTFYLGENLQEFKKINIEINCEEGTNRFRDPFVGRDTNGDILILTTQGYYNQGIYKVNGIETDNINIDLINFSQTNYDLKMSGIYTWSPQFIYDGENYIVYYSDSNKDNSCIYAVKTRDFETFSYPYVLFDAGYKIIDACIVNIDGRYYMYYKDERDEEKNIKCAISDTLEGAWRLSAVSYYDIEKLEGPFVVRDRLNQKLTLYADAYQGGEIHKSIIENQNTNIIELKKDDDLSKLKIRHFSIIELTEKEYKKLLRNVD